MINSTKLQKGSTYKNRGIIKWNDELGFYTVGYRLNFVLPKNIIEQLFSWTRWPSESGGLIFFELSKSPPRTLIAKEIMKINNVSPNPWFEFLPDREEVKELILKRSQSKKLFLPTFFHIHPVSKEQSQYDFFRQAGPSHEDIASTFDTFPYLYTGKLSLPEFIVCKHPSDNMLFIGFYDSVRLEAMELQKIFYQQEVGLVLLKGLIPSLHYLKKELKEMDLISIIVYLVIGYFVYKKFQPQIHALIKNISDIISAEWAFKILGTIMAIVDQVPFYTLVKPREGCYIILPAKSYLKMIISSTSKPRVTKKVIIELKKLTQ